MSPFSTLTNLVLLFDVDGVLVKYGEKTVPAEIVSLLRNKPLIKMLVSGKSLSWCWGIGEQIRANAVFAENALVYRSRCREAPVLTADLVDLQRLKQIINFKVIAEAEYLAEITLDGVTSLILFEPGKNILTFWIEPKEKMRMFKLNDSLWTEEYVLQKIRHTILDNKLFIEIAGPFKDGGVDFLPMGVDKSRAVDKAKELFPNKRIIVFGDDLNDIPMVSRDEVFAVTFLGNANPKVIERVMEKQAKGEGMIFEKPGYEGGLEDALAWIFKNQKEEKNDGNGYAKNNRGLSSAISL